MTIPLIRARANPNQELYVRALSSIYRYGFRIYDPDFALAQEPDPYEKCRKDPVVAQAIDIRLHGVAGRRWRVMPAGREKQDRELAMIVEDAIGSIIGFSEARYELAQAVIRARSYAYIQGRRQRVRLGDAPAAKWWVPLSLKDIDRRRFRYVPMNNLMDSAPDSFPDAYTERTSPVNRKQVKEPFDVIPNTWGGKNIRVQLQLFSVARNRWERMIHPEYLLNLTYNDSEMRLGYGRGLMESIYYYLWAKTTLIKEGLQGVEKWARGLWTVKIDGLRDASTGKPNDAVRDAWLEVMEDFQSRHVGAFDSKDEVDIIEGGGTGNTIIMDFIRYLDDAMRAVILGSTLPFGGGKGAGSYARAKEEGDVHESLIQFDRDKLDEEITRSLIGLFLRLNRRNILALGLGDARTPYFSVVQERMEDPSQSANVLSIMSNIGMKVREDEAYRKLGFTPPTEEDRVLDLTPEQMGGEEEFVEGEEEGFEEEEAEEASQEDVDEELGKLDDLEDKVENLSDEVTVYLSSYRHHFCRDHNVSLETFDRITMQGKPPRAGGGPPPEGKGPDPRIKNPKWDSSSHRWVSADKDDDKGKHRPPPGAEPIEVGGPGQGPDIEEARTKIKEVTDLVDDLTKQVESGDLNKKEMKAGKDKVLEEIKAIRNMLGGSERVSPMDDPSHPMHIKEVTPEFREKKAEISDELLAGQNKELEKTVKEITVTLKEMKKEGATAKDISKLQHGLNQAKSELKEGGLLAAERAGEAAGKKRETIAAEKEAKKQTAERKEQAKQQTSERRAAKQKRTAEVEASKRTRDAYRTSKDPEHWSHIERGGKESQEFENEWSDRKDPELSDRIKDLKVDIRSKKDSFGEEKGHDVDEINEHRDKLNSMQREYRLATFEKTRRNRTARDKKEGAAKAAKEKPPADQEEKAAQEQAAKEQAAQEEAEKAAGAGGGQTLEPGEEPEVEEPVTETEEEEVSAAPEVDEEEVTEEEAVSAETIQDSDWEGASGEKKAELVEKAKATWEGASAEERESIKDHYVQRTLSGELKEREAGRRSGIPRRSFRRHKAKAQAEAEGAKPAEEVPEEATGGEDLPSLSPIQEAWSRRDKREGEEKAKRGEEALEKVIGEERKKDPDFDQKMEKWNKEQEGVETPFDKERKAAEKDEGEAKPEAKTDENLSPALILHDVKKQLEGMREPTFENPRTEEERAEFNKQVGRLTRPQWRKLANELREGRERKKYEPGGPLYQPPLGYRPPSKEEEEAKPEAKAEKPISAAKAEREARSRFARSRSRSEQRVQGAKKDVSTMPAMTINRELDVLEKERSDANREFIDSGRGGERHSEIMKQDDPLSRKYQEIEQRRESLDNEIRERMGPIGPGKYADRFPKGARGMGPRKKK